MLERLRMALATTGYKFAHFGWARDAKALKGDYGVYAEDGENSLQSNNRHGETALEGTVDYFTRDASDAPRQTIEAAFGTLDGFAWRLNSIQFEEDTGYIHYEWVFEVV